MSRFNRSGLTIEEMAVLQPSGERGMPKFRKKPVEIEAMQNVVGRAETISSWMKGHGVTPEWDGGTFTIKTLEGNMRADRGDWIIRGVKGEFYPCNPDIFAATYEAA